MESTRTVMVANSATQKRYKITTNASTLGELKKCLAENGISYGNMTFTEGISKTTLSDDNALLPSNIPFKGGTTNNLVLLLTNSRKNIQSGMTRKEAYEAIKGGNFAEQVKESFGRNFTQVSTADLESFLAEHDCKVSAAEPCEANTCHCNHEACEDITKYTQVPTDALEVLRQRILMLQDNLSETTSNLLTEMARISGKLNELLGVSNVEVTEADLEDILSDFEQ